MKFGALRTPDGGWAGVDGRPAAVNNFLAYSLQRLKTDHVDIYRLARLDPHDAVTLMGARTRRQLGVALAARDLQLSDEAIAQIETAVPPGSVAGARYAPAAMVHLDSERPTPRP